jgi:hypothetical protein
VLPPPGGTPVGAGKRSEYMRPDAREASRRRLQEPQNKPRFPKWFPKVFWLLCHEIKGCDQPSLTLSQKILQRLSGFLGTFLEQPVPSIFQHNHGHLAGNRMRLLPERFPVGLLAADS